MQGIHNLKGNRGQKYNETKAKNMTKIIQHRPSLMPLLCSGLISTQLPAQQHLILPENHPRFLRQNLSNHSFA